MSATTTTASLRASWRRLPLENVPLSLAARSSHCLALHAGRAYIFGGEQQPRTPIGNEVLVVDVARSGEAATSEVKIVRAAESSSSSSSWPAPRVGAAMTAHHASQSLLLWGGRGGKEMKAIDVRQSINDDDDGEDVWRFDTQSLTWSQLRTHAASSAFPVARSFHTITNAEDRVFLHAGCPAQGRLSTLHSLNLRTRTWQTLPDAPEPARGGTVLTAVAGVRASDPPLLARWGGFCGEEVGGPLDVFDGTTLSWTSFDVQSENDAPLPPKRSVHGFVPYVSAKATYLNNKRVVALLFMGEGEGAPKELGHDGAGKFLSDVYALLRTTDGTTYSWLKLDVAASESSDDRPEPRGWFAFDVQPASSESDGSGVQVVLHGGLNADNKRLADAWVLEVNAD